MGKLGFKEISLQNWLQRDETLTHFKKIGLNGKLDTISPEDYLRGTLTPRLIAAVPENIQALFEVARGAIAYGYLFYPLYALAEEQLFRVAEAAVKQRCKQLEMPRNAQSNFVRCIKWLAQWGIICGAGASRWHNIRHLRNAASHPQRQMISTPMDALATLANVAEEINSLWGGIEPIAFSSSGR
jgi:hypothetical protein